jgi:hypothetical protein
VKHHDRAVEARRPVRCKSHDWRRGPSASRAAQLVPAWRPNLPGFATRECNTSLDRAITNISPGRSDSVASHLRVDSSH